MAETKNKKSVFETMSAVDVSPYLFQKQSMSYLPWSKAIELLKLHYPDADVQPVMYECEKFISAPCSKDKDGSVTYENHVTKVSMLYTPDKGGCTVRTRLRIPSESIDVEETLPVLDFKNKPVSPENVTADQVNKAIKRCGTKNIAVATGLGLGLWHKEEISDAAATQKILDKLDRQDAEQDAIAKFKKKVADGYDRTKLAEWLASNFGVNNPAKIKDDKVLAKLSEMLDKLDVKDFQSEKKTTAKKESK